MKDVKQKINEDFFEHVKEDDADLDAIMARGELNQMRNDEHAASSKSIQIEAVELMVGANYRVSGCGADGDLAFNFCVEEGGILAGEAVGTVQAGKLVMTAGAIDYTGSFSNKTVVDGNWKDAAGATGAAQLTFT